MKKFLKKVLACSFMLCLTSGGVSAQIPAEVQSNAQHVKFVQQHSGWKIAGNLYLPSNYKPGKKYPAIITVHPGGGVKEQTSGLYAMLLAKKGFVTLAFDASHQGESEGSATLKFRPNVWKTFAVPSIICPRCRKSTRIKSACLEFVRAVAIR